MKEASTYHAKCKVSRHYWTAISAGKGDPEVASDCTGSLPCRPYSEYAMLILRDHNALRPSKLNQMHINGPPYELVRLAAAPSLISGDNEVTKPEHALVPIEFYCHCSFLAS